MELVLPVLRDRSILRSALTAMADCAGGQRSGWNIARHTLGEVGKFGGESVLLGQREGAGIWPSAVYSRKSLVVLDHSEWRASVVTVNSMENGYEFG